MHRVRHDEGLKIEIGGFRRFTHGARATDADELGCAARGTPMHQAVCVEG